MKNLTIILFALAVMCWGCGTTTTEEQSVEEEPVAEETTEDAPTEEPSTTTENDNSSTVIVGNLEVMKEDLDRMDWDEAIEACAALGDGWRLPTKDEWNFLYENRDRIGGFGNKDYWSSTEGGDGGAWRQSFPRGGQYYNAKYNTFYVMAVRDI